MNKRIVRKSVEGIIQFPTWYFEDKSLESILWLDSTFWAVKLFCNYYIFYIKIQIKIWLSPTYKKNHATFNS